MPLTLQVAVFVLFPSPLLLIDSRPRVPILARILHLSGMERSKLDAVSYLSGVLRVPEVYEMKPTTLKKIRKRHPRQEEIDAEAAALLIATRERMKGPDARRSRRKTLETSLLLPRGS